MDTAQSKPLDGVEVDSVPLVDLLTQYKPVELHKRVESLFSDFEQAAENPDYQMEVLRARRRAFLHAVHAEHIDSSSGKELALQTIGKTRLVVAKADFTKGELVLAPLAMNIVAATSDKIPPLAVKFKHPRLTNRKDENLFHFTLQSMRKDLTRQRPMRQRKRMQ